MSNLVYYFYTVVMGVELNSKEISERFLLPLDAQQ